MKFEIDNPETLLDFFNYLKRNYSNVILEVRDGKLCSYGKDNAGVSYYEFGISAKTEGTGTIQVDLGKFLEILSRMKNEPTIFETNENDSRLTIKNVALSGKVKRYVIGIQETTQTKHNEEDIKGIEELAKGRTRINTNLLWDALLDDVIGDTFLINIQNGQLSFEDKSEIEKWMTQVTKDSQELIDASGNGKSMFGIDFLKMIPRNLNVELKVGNDTPLLVRCNEPYDLLLLIAPRVVEE